MKIELKAENENYAARFVTLRHFEPIPGADRIKNTKILSNNVILGNDVSEGTRGVYFPVECQINKEFLFKNNLFSSPEMNEDQKTKGYFDKKGRVRALSLRGARSEGCFMPLKSFSYLTNEEWNLAENTPFDTINDVEICKKYVIQTQVQNPPRVGRKVKKQPSRMIEGQYKLHYDTPKLGDNIHMVKPDDYIYIDNKLHGASISMGRVLVKRKLSFWERVKMFFGAKVATTEFANIYASRSVIKNGTENQENNHYYGHDIWKIAFDKVQHLLTDNLQIYGELVGFTPSGGAIQKSYDYSCKPGEQEFYVYRMTSKNANGEIQEWGMDDIVGFCEKNGIKHVPIFYKGLAKDLFPEISITEHWHQNFIDKLRSSFNMEKKCELCRNDVPAEGITLKIQGKNVPALKLKSFRFLKKESESLDQGVIDIESEASIKTEE